MRLAVDDGLDRLFVRDLDLSARVGVHPHEQSAPQRIRLNICLHTIRGGSGLGVVDYEAIVIKLRTLVSASHVPLVEDLADQVAAVCLEDPRVRCATVRIEKPSALPDAFGVGVEITRRGNPCEF
jgi:dihydroneopterin aldolase